jgi:hypothetical protein
VQNRALVAALYVNAAALIGGLLYMAAGNSSLLPAAMAQQPQPQTLSAAEGMSLVPVQISPNTWGCYLLDTQAQVLCVYQYSPGEKLLRLQAARNIAYDKKLGAFNTAPLPREIADLVSKEAGGGGANPPAGPAGK